MHGRDRTADWTHEILWQRGAPPGRTIAGFLIRVPGAYRQILGRQGRCPDQGIGVKPKRSVPGTIDEYIAQFPENVREILEQVRMTIREAAPEAEEIISYRIPAFRRGGRMLVYFAAFRKHIGVYPAPVGNPELAGELSPYASGRGTARFPLDTPIPYSLIAKIVRFRIREEEARAAAQGKKRK